MKIFEFNKSFVVLHDIRCAYIKKSDNAEFPYQICIWFNQSPDFFESNFREENKAIMEYAGLLKAVRLCNE